MNKLKKTLLACAAFVSLQFAIVPAISYAQGPIEPLEASCNTGNSSQSDVCDTQDQTENPVAGNGGILLKIVDMIAWAVGVAAVIMILIGGYKIVMSNGDANSVKTGRNTILYALVGVVVVLVSRSLIIFVINRV